VNYSLVCAWGEVWVQLRFFLKETNRGLNMTYHLVQDTKNAERLRFAERMNGAVTITNNGGGPFVLQDPRERMIKPSGTPLPERGDDGFRGLGAVSKEVETLGGGR